MTEDNRDTPSFTDEEEEFDEEHTLPEFCGILSKWTNYIHGWQDRYVVLKDGTVSYYKSENEKAIGCRGAVSLAKAVITPHEFDECRFDVAVNDNLWYLRTNSLEERQRWIEYLELHKQAESGYGSVSSLRRHGSVLSVQSGTSMSTASASSFKRARRLREKLMEMETFRDILCRQVETLQSYFDACASAVAHYTNGHDHLDNDEVDDVDEGEKGNHRHAPEVFQSIDNTRNNDLINILQQHGAHSIDFKGEAITFKATTAGILATMSHCIDLMSQREEVWRKRLDKEIDKRKRFEESYKSLIAERPKAVIMGGPDFEEGPHSRLNEEEFYDAVDAALDKLEKEDESKMTSLIQVKTATPPATSLDPNHPLFNEINMCVVEHFRSADMTASDVAQTWTLVTEEGDLKVYKKETVEDGILIEPHKAVYTVTGISGHELCHYFFDPAVRLEWDSLLESTQVVEWVSKDTVITYQTHRRVWPSSQRDSLFWSTIRHSVSEDEDGPDYWAVINHTTDHISDPHNSKMVRLRFNVALICQTIVTPPGNGKAISREHLTCKIQYSAVVNPGGWAPASVVKLISKRELPKFLKTFAIYVQQKTKDLPILF